MSSAATVVVYHSLFAVQILEPLVWINTNQDGTYERVDFISHVSDSKSINQAHLTELL